MRPGLSDVVSCGCVQAPLKLAALLTALTLGFFLAGCYIDEWALGSSTMSYDMRFDYKFGISSVCVTTTGSVSAFGNCHPCTVKCVVC
jgi:hypothetical protein